MMKKKTVQLLLSLVLLTAMGMFYFKVKNISESAQNETLEVAEQENESVEFLSFENDSICGVKFLINGDEVSFVKESDRWEKEDEPEFPLDQELVENAVSSMEYVEADYVIENTKDLSEYDLQKPINVITLLDKNGKETEIQVGLKNEDGQYYVCKNDEENVYLIKENVVSPFMKGLYNYSKMNELPTLESDCITAVQVKKADTEYQLQKKADSIWYIEGEEEEKADTTKTDALLYKIAALSYENLVNYRCENDADYGLEEPYAVVSITYQLEEAEEELENAEEENAKNDKVKESLEDEDLDKELENTSESNAESTSALQDAAEQKLVLYVGDIAADGYRYVKTEGSEEIHTMSESMLGNMLETTAKDYWNLSVFYLSINELETLKVNYNGETNICNVSRETLQENGEEDGKTEKTYYFMDETEVDCLKFSSFYNKLVDFVAADRLIERPNLEKNAYFTAEFTDLSGNTEKMEIFEFDEDYNMIFMNARYYLINRMSVKQMIDAFNDVRDTKK